MTSPSRPPAPTLIARTVHPLTWFRRRQVVPAALPLSPSPAQPACPIHRLPSSFLLRFRLRATGLATAASIRWCLSYLQIQPCRTMLVRPAPAQRHRWLKSAIPQLVLARPGLRHRPADDLRPGSRGSAAIRIGKGRRELGGRAQSEVDWR